MSVARVSPTAPDGSGNAPGGEPRAPKLSFGSWAIWRPLARTQDAIAVDGLAFLREWRAGWPPEVGQARTGGIRRPECDRGAV